MPAPLRQYLTWAPIFLLVAAGWLALYYAVTGSTLTVANLLGFALPETFSWLAWGAVAPLVLYLVRRRAHALQPPSWRWLEHLGFALAVGLLVFAISVTLTYLYYHACLWLSLPLARDLPTLLERQRDGYLAIGLPLSVILYALVAATGLAGRYVREVADERARAARLQAQSREAQLAAMKMQLQPHFLFNALNTVSATLHEDPARADRMLAQLGDFLRATLALSEARTVSLRRELDFVRQYLRMEQFRLEDRLAVAYDVDDDALDAAVPHLLLQPLVENAIRHGIARLPDGGHVRISAHREDHRLAVAIENAAPAGTAADVEYGDGLRNVARRLDTGYGAVAALRLSTCETPPTFCARVVLPLAYQTERRA